MLISMMINRLIDSRRLADHFIGKSHIAFLAIRRKLKQLEEMDLPDPLGIITFYDV